VVAYTCVQWDDICNFNLTGYNIGSRMAGPDVTITSTITIFQIFACNPSISQFAWHNSIIRQVIEMSLQLGPLTDQHSLRPELSRSIKRSASRNKPNLRSTRCSSMVVQCMSHGIFTHLLAVPSRPVLTLRLGCARLLISGGNTRLSATPLMHVTR
jgi:hypothetical protein